VIIRALVANRKPRHFRERIVRRPAGVAIWRHGSPAARSAFPTGRNSTHRYSPDSSRRGRLADPLDPPIFMDAFLS